MPGSKSWVKPTLHPKWEPSFWLKWRKPQSHISVRLSAEPSLQYLLISTTHKDKQPKMLVGLLDFKSKESSTNQLPQLCHTVCKRRRTRSLPCMIWEEEHLTSQFYKSVKESLKSRPPTETPPVVDRTWMVSSRNICWTNSRSNQALMYPKTRLPFRD